ncbi:hypothetical protein wVul_0391 [Wolbachia endosymbiont of Armadillidium vulgare str. wVulC]|nr:hypothetical protein wVul_0391 [Wolbachia endosymbiont of Armadillidium vulgare str. wVulC]
MRCKLFYSLVLSLKVYLGELIILSLSYLYFLNLTPMVYFTLPFTLNLTTYVSFASWLVSFLFPLTQHSLSLKPYFLSSNFLAPLPTFLFFVVNLSKVLKD